MFNSRIFFNVFGKNTLVAAYAFKYLPILIGLFCFLSPSLALAQSGVTIFGTVVDSADLEPIPSVNVVLMQNQNLKSLSLTDVNGHFTIEHVASGEYVLLVTQQGYRDYKRDIYVGSNATYLDIGRISLNLNSEQLSEVTVSSEVANVSGSLDSKSFDVSEELSTSGGSVLQAMSNLPGVTLNDGQVMLRGSNRVVVLIDGNQTALTGFGNQNGLDNLPASSIERIEIINNPSAKYDANGNAGIINIITKKDVGLGWNGTVGFTAGVGALWERRQNITEIRPQYTMTPKLNPSVSLNYRTSDLNFFVEADDLYTETLNKNEYVTRTYDNGTIIEQQLKRNRNTNFTTAKAGLDWYLNQQNRLTISGSYSREAIADYGDQPFVNANTGENYRLWQFLEDETVTAAMGSIAFQHDFTEPGHVLKLAFNYTFDREDEKYFFTNSTPQFNVDESFALIADQKVADFMLDYSKPLAHGLFEGGVKIRNRTIPTDMQFYPSATHSVLDTGADGRATYSELIPAVYGNYVYESRRFDAELGLRIEYVNLNYEVDPNHNTYESNGYHYFQPFPNFRFTYKLNQANRLSLFFNRRVDRPDEVDIRIFPKYDDAEIVKVGNPALRPQFTNSIEIGYKNVWEKGNFYGAVYHKMSNGTITRVATNPDTTNIIYNTSQNVGNSTNTGVELALHQKLTSWWDLDININAYYNHIDAFTIHNLYPNPHSFTSDEEQMFSGNVKVISDLSLSDTWSGQVSIVYLAPDVIPQGTIDARFSVNLGLKKSVQSGRGEFFLNATDLFNTLVVSKRIQGDGFYYTSKDYYETQVIRVGYRYKF